MIPSMCEGPVEVRVTIISQLLSKPDNPAEGTARAYLQISVSLIRPLNSMR
jgi:hypothetical protein